MNRLVRLLMHFSKPFALGHIYGSDGSLYMGRFALCENRFFAARLHHIAREDRDRHMHDHPWNFWSVLLQGGYIEARPTSETPVLWENGAELATLVWRNAWSWSLFARRRATDRHIIIHVKPNTWTLFITFKYCNKWGFYTPAGKIPYREYLGLPPKEAQ